MEDNAHVTADGGADTSKEVGKDEELVPDDSTNEAEVEEEDFLSPNKADRMAYLTCNLRIQQAREAGDTASEARARDERAVIANRFVQRNARFAHRRAQPFLRDHSTSAEHLAAAMLGLWEAFAGTKPQDVDGVIVNADGSLSPTGGWDPSKGTFSTFAGPFISGQTRRSVKSTEGAFTGIKYSTWTMRPKVDAARTALAEELGRTPSIAQIAKRAGVTEDTVRACTKAAPVSLDALVSSDGNATRGDLIEDRAADTDLGQMAEDEIARRAADLAGMDLLVLLLRTGMHGRERVSVVRAADKLAIGRGSVALAAQRAQDQLAGEGVDISALALLEV